MHYTVMPAWSAPYGVTGSACPNRLAKPNRLLDHIPENGARLARFRASSPRYSSQTRTVTLGDGPKQYDTGITAEYGLWARKG